MIRRSTFVCGVGSAHIRVAYDTFGSTHMMDVWEKFSLSVLSMLANSVVDSMLKLAFKVLIQIVAYQKVQRDIVTSDGARGPNNSPNLNKGLVLLIIKDQVR